MRNTSPELTPEEAAFVRRLNEIYAPPPMERGEQAAFDRRLRGRIARRRRVWPALSVAATAATAALLWLGIRPAPVAVSPDPPLVATTEVPPTEMEEILSVYDWATGETNDLAMALPADYQVLAADYLER